LTHSRFLPAMLALITVLLAGGCAVDQAKEVAAYRDLVDVEPHTAEEFEPGEPLSVRRAMLLANARNERLSIEGESYVQAVIERRRAAAAFLPTISLVPSYVRRDSVPGDGAGTGAAQTSTFDVPVQGGINLFNGFGDRARLLREGATIDQRRALLLDVQEALLLDVAQIYFQVLRSERSVRVLENSLEVQDERLRDIRGRQRAGVARPLDVAQTESQTSATRVSLIAAQNDVRNGRAVLAFLTSAPVQRSELSDAYSAPPLEEPLEQLRQRGLLARRDVQAAEAALRAAEHDIRVAVSQYYPSVTLDLNVFLYRETAPDQRRWDAVLRANLPIFSAGLIEADVRDAWSRLRQAALIESLVKRQVIQQIEVALHDFQASNQRLAELRTQLEAAEAAFQQAEQSYNVGLATNLERVIAQDLLLNAQLEMVSEEYDQKVLHLNLLRAIGALREELENDSARR
jgi:outer membrane protein TolC